MPGTVAVVGCGGKTGSAVADALARSGWSVRRLDRQRGDLREPGTLLDACSGVDALYHFAPNFSPDEELIGSHAIAACRAHDARLVFHSVLAPGIEAMPHHWRKLRVEEHLWASTDVAWTVLRPAPYFQNLLPYVAEARSEGRFRLPFDPGRALAMVDLADVGAAAVAVLTDGDDHVHATWDLCAEAGVTHHEVAAHLGVSVERVDPESRLGVSTDLAAMFHWYDRHGLPGSTAPLRALLDRPGRRLRAFLDA